MTGRARLLGALLTATMLASACGSGTPAITATASRVLKADVAALARAAHADDTAATQTALARLTRHVQAQQHAGQLQTARASSILAAGARVAADVASAVPPAPSPTPTPTPDQGNGKGKGDGKGDGGGDGGD